MKIDISKLEKFIKTARSIVGRDEFSPYSLEDIYSLAYKFEIEGIIYLEKFEDKRHVSVLLDLDKNSLTLYDPLLGIKKKSYNEIQLGMYCKPVGSFKDEFQTYAQQLKSNESRDIWTQYEQIGKLLFNFLKQHSKFRSVYTKGSLSITNLPALQNNPSSSDCAPISLYIMSLFNSVYSKP